MNLKNVVFSEEIQKKLAVQEEFVKKLSRGGIYLISEVESNLKFEKKSSGNFFRYKDEQGNFYVFYKVEDEGLFKYIP